MVSKVRYTTDITASDKEEFRTYAREHSIQTTTVRDYRWGGITGDNLELPDFNEQVRRGCILLDAMSSGWMDHIDLDLLDLESTTRCVLGQAYAENPGGIPGYDWQVKAYMESFALDPATYGFDLTDAQKVYITVMMNFKHKAVISMTSRTYEHLTSTWRTVIRDRKARAAAAVEVTPSLG